MLTERESEVVKLRGEGLCWREIGERLGTTKSAANSSFRAAMRKMDKAENPDAYRREPRPNRQTVEVKNPAKAAEFLNSALEPFATVEPVGPDVDYFEVIEAPVVPGCILLLPLGFEPHQRSAG